MWLILIWKKKNNLISFIRGIVSIIASSITESKTPLHDGNDSLLD
jgi:hypothetical protein